MTIDILAKGNTIQREIQTLSKDLVIYEKSFNDMEKTGIEKLKSNQIEKFIKVNVTLLYVNLTVEDLERFLKFRIAEIKSKIEDLERDFVNLKC